jgi:hypothetical protein
MSKKCFQLQVGLVLQTFKAVKLGETLPSPLNLLSFQGVSGTGEGWVKVGEGCKKTNFHHLNPCITKG